MKIIYKFMWGCSSLIWLGGNYFIYFVLFGDKVKKINMARRQNVIWIHHEYINTTHHARLFCAKISETIYEHSSHLPWLIVLWTDQTVSTRLSRLSGVDRGLLPAAGSTLNFVTASRVTSTLLEDFATCGRDITVMYFWDAFRMLQIALSAEGHGTLDSDNLMLQLF